MNCCLQFRQCMYRGPSEKAMQSDHSQESHDCVRAASLSAPQFTFTTCQWREWKSALTALRNPEATPPAKQRPSPLLCPYSICEIICIHPDAREVGLFPRRLARGLNRFWMASVTLKHKPLSAAVSTRSLLSTGGGADQARLLFWVPGIFGQSTQLALTFQSVHYSLSARCWRLSLMKMALYLILLPKAGHSSTWHSPSNVGPGCLAPVSLPSSVWLVFNFGGDFFQFGLDFIFF